MSDHEDVIRKLAIRDDPYIDSILSHEHRGMAGSHLDPKTQALVRIGALIAIDAAPPSYMCPVESARRHGASIDEIVGILVAVMPTVGSGRVVSAAPKLGLALGYDVEAALERLEPGATRA